MPTLYYVTAVEKRRIFDWRRDQQHGGGQKEPPRHDLASFFDPGAATAHAKTIDEMTWAIVSVEPREESQESLHVSHGGKRGG